jgi:hypothetical protein
MIAAGLAVCIFGADKIQPLQAKLGLWEITVTNQMRGQMPISPEALAKMTPEQRERMDAMMKQRAAKGGTPRMRQTCLTQEKLDRAPFSEDNKSCNRTIITSTAKAMEGEELCSEPDGPTRTAHTRSELMGIRI